MKFIFQRSKIALFGGLFSISQMSESTIRGKSNCRKKNEIKEQMVNLFLVYTTPRAICIYVNQCVYHS